MDSTELISIFGAAAAGNQFSQPLTKLIETTSAAIGVLYEPTRIRRRARAEADAQEILAAGDAKAQEIARRAAHRIENKELRRQRNIEKIVRSSVEFLPETVSEAPVNEDWRTQFFECGQDVSDEQMQSLWSQILAGEVARPGSFSLRTLHAVKLLRTEDAHLFTNYCRFVWSACNAMQWFFIDPTVGSFWPPHAISQINDFYTSNGITSLDRVHLESLNLIHVSRGGRLLICPTQGSVQLIYHGRLHCLRHHDQNRGLEMPVDMLTDIGRELAPVSGSNPIPQFEQMLLQSIPGGFAIDS